MEQSVIVTQQNQVTPVQSVDSPHTETRSGSFAGKLIIAVRAIKALILKIVAKITMMIGTVALACRLCKERNEEEKDKEPVYVHMSKLNKIIPGVVEERREQTVKTESGLQLPSPASTSESLPPFTTADPDQLHRVCLTADDINPARLPALPEPTDLDPGKKALRLAITGLKLMADEYFPAMLRSSQARECDLDHAQLTLGISRKIPIEHIPGLLKKMGCTEPLRLEQVIGLYHACLSHHSLSLDCTEVETLLIDAGAITGTQLYDLVTIDEIPQKIKELGTALSRAGQPSPEEFPVDIPPLMSYLSTTDYRFSVLPAYPGEQEPVVLLEFIISAVQTCRTRHHIEERPAAVFCDVLTCTQHYYYWLATLREKQDTEFLEMKRQILNQMTRDLEKHHILIIPCNQNTDLLQLVLDRSNPEQPVARGQILGVKMRTQETDEVVRKRKIEIREERERIKSIRLDPVDYRKLANSHFMDMLVLDKFSASQWIATWPGHISFNGEEHTCKYYRYAYFLPLIKEYFSTRERTIIKLQLYESIESTIDQTLKEMPVVQHAVESRQSSMLEPCCYYRRVDIALAKAGRMDVPATLREGVAKCVFKRTRLFGIATGNYMPLPANVPDNNIPVTPLVAAECPEGKELQPRLYVAGEWHKLPVYETGQNVFEYIVACNRKIGTLRQHESMPGHVTFNKFQRQQAILHLCEQLPDARDPIWNKPYHSEEHDFRPLLTTLIQLIKTNFVSAEGIENPSAHEAVLAIKIFTISLKLRMEQYESNSETALSDDIRKHGQQLIHHYATEMLYQFGKIQKYLALPSSQDRDTLHASLHCIRNMAKYKDGEPDKRYVLLKPADHMFPATATAHNIHQQEWETHQVMALGPISNIEPGKTFHDNTDIIVLANLLKRNIGFAVEEYVAKSISPAELTVAEYQHMKQQECFLCREDEKIMFHCIHGNHDQVKNDPALFDCLLCYFYCSKNEDGRPAGDWQESKTRPVMVWHPPRLDDTFAVNYNHYPAELANYYLLRESSNAMVLLCCPNNANKIRYHHARILSTARFSAMCRNRTTATTKSVAYMFEHIAPSEITCYGKDNTQFYLINASSTIAAHRQTGIQLQATETTQDIMQKHIGIHQNALYRDSSDLCQPLMRRTDYDYSTYELEAKAGLLPPDMLILFRGTFQPPYVDNHYHLAVFMDRYARYLSHPTIKPLVELAWFGDCRKDTMQDNYSDPSVARTLMDLVIRGNQDAIPFIEQMAGISWKLKIHETSSDREKYTGNYGQLANSPRLLVMKIVAGAINHMAFHPNARISPDVRQRADRLLIQIWDEEVNGLPANIQDPADHILFNHTCMALLAIVDNVHACYPEGLQERAVDVLTLIAHNNTWGVTLPEFLEKCSSGLLGQEMNAALRAIRHLEPLYLEQTGKTAVASPRPHKTSRTARRQTELTIGHDTYTAIPACQVPAGLKEAMSGQQNQMPLPALSFCCRASDLPHPEVITIINTDTRVVVARFDTSTCTLSRATPITECNAEPPEAVLVDETRVDNPVVALKRFSCPDARDSVCIIWADCRSNRPVAVETINGEWQFYITGENHWRTPCFPGYFVTSVTKNTLHLAADNNINARKLILKENKRYFCYDMDGYDNITGYPDGHESMAACLFYLFHKFNQPGASDYHLIIQCQTIITEFRRSGWVLEQKWQNELNRMFSTNHDLMKDPSIRLLALKLAACQYLNNPERLANGVKYEEATEMQYIYIEYMARRRELDTNDRLTNEEERVLLQAMANVANEQRRPKYERRCDLAGRPYFIHNLVIERSRFLDHKLYSQLHRWPLLIPELPEFFGEIGGNFTRRIRLQRKAYAKDQYWKHDLDLLPADLLRNPQMMEILQNRTGNQPWPELAGNGLIPTSQHFLHNALYYYDIARNPKHSERPQLEKFLAHIVKGETHVQNLTMFLQLVLKKPERFGPAEITPGSDLAPDPEDYDLPANYGSMISEYLRHSWRNPGREVFTPDCYFYTGNSSSFHADASRYSRAREYLRDCEYHEYRQQPLGMLSWYFFQAYRQNQAQLQARVELKMFDRTHQLQNQHPVRLPILQKVRLNYPDVPPCEPVQYQPLEWQCHEDDNDHVAASFQATLDILHKQYGHLATEGVRLLTPIAPEEKARQLQAKTAGTAELREQIKTARDAVGDDNPCLAYPLERLVKGLEIHETQIAQEKTRPGYRLGTTCTEIGTALPELEKHLSQRQEQLKDQVTLLEKALLAQINSFDTLDAAIHHRLKTFRSISILELVSVVGKGRESQLAELHPEWNDTKRRQVVRQCIEYLLYSTELQHMERILPQCQQLQTLVNSIQNAGSNELTDDAKLLQEQLVGLIVQERAYCGNSSNPQTRLEFLLFEHIMNIRIRPDQVESCLKLDEHVRVNAEIPTGSGKSTLILPYLCYKAWLDGKSPILVVPPELIEQQKGILKNGLCKIFGTDLSELHFDRERARNPEYLSALLDRLKTDHRKKHILLCRMNELHAIICLQKKEILFQLGSPDQDKITLHKALEKLDELQRFIEENCDFIIDESRTNFNPNHSYDYAVGRRVPQSDVTREAMTHIFQVIHQHLKDEYMLDFMGVASTGPVIITREIYRKTIIVTLADNLIPLFTTRSAHELNRNKKLLADLATCGHQFNEPLSRQDINTIHDILTRLMRQDLTMKPLEPANRNILNAFLDNHRKRPLYATIREALGTTMENTLCRKADDSYGLNEEATRVIPYTNGVPKPEAEFGSPLVNTILTVQAFLFTPISRAMMHRWITILSQLEQDLSLDEVQDHPQMQLFFDIARQCPSLHGITPSRLSAIELDRSCECINQPDNLNLKLRYVCEVILPEVKMYQRKVTSSAFSIVSFCSRLKTASGTVDVNVLPRELMTLEAAQAPIPNLMTLLQGKWHEPALRIEATGDEKQRLLNIVRQCPKATVIIDAGDCFRSLSHQEIADCLHAEIYDGNSQSAMANTQGILVFDHDGVAWVKKPAGGKLVLFDNCGIAPDQLAIAMQKNKAEGTDWKMHIKAHGVVTVDRTTDLSLMIQAVGRMRQLQKGQSVQLAYMREQEALLLGKDDETAWTPSRPEGDCTNGALVQYLAGVEGQRMIKQAVPLLGNFMRARLEKILYIDFPRHVKFDEKAMVTLVRKTREFLVPQTHADPVKLLGSEPVTLTLQEMASRVFDQYVPLINEARSVHTWLGKQLDQTALRREYDDFIAGIVLPKTFETLSGVVNNAADLTSEVAVTQEKEQEQEVEIQTMPVIHTSRPYYDLYKPVGWDGDFLAWTKNRTPAFCLGNTRVYFGPDTTQFAARKKWPGLGANPLNKRYHKPVYHAMYFQREGETCDTLFLGDIGDMKQVKQYIDAHATETPVLQSAHDETPQPGTSMRPVTTEHIWQLDGIADGCYIHEGRTIIMTLGNGRFAAADDDDKRRIMLLLKLSAHTLADRLPHKAEKNAFRFWIQQSPEEARKIKAYLEQIQRSNCKMSKAIESLCRDKK